MRVNKGWAVAILLGMTIAVPARVAAQAPPPAAPPAAPAAQGGRGAGRGRVGGFVPGQERPPGDPAQIARGKTIYEISCRVCHGADLRGGDMGGPNLLRSQLALSDQDGELIVPVVQAGRAAMPPVPMKAGDGK